MREVSPEQYRDGVLIQVAGRVFRVGYLEPIHLMNGNYLVSDPREVTNAESQEKTHAVRF